jgi:2-desacetyl-2-hydroxyethyl bacteriochlorophyllide A dehydrogenase
MKINRIIFAAKERVEIETVEQEIKLGPNQVLIESVRSMVSPGTELAALRQNHTRSNIPNPPAWLCYPSVPGYLMVGTVVDKGAAVKAYNIGDRVVGEGGGCWNTHASHVVMSDDEKWLVKLPAGVSWEEGVTAKLGSITMYGLRVLHHEYGENVAVLGLGLIGQIAVRLCSLGGFGHVVGSDPLPQRRKVAQLAPHVTVTTPEEIVAAGQGEAAGLKDGYDNVIEASGHPKAFIQATEIARIRGRISVVSAPHLPVELKLYDKVMNKSLQILGAHGSSMAINLTARDRWNEMRQKQLYLQLIAAKRIDVNPLLTHQVPYTQAPAMYRGLMEQPAEYMGVVFQWK